MSDLIVPNTICLQPQKQLVNLNNISVLLKGVVVDLRARNFVHAKTSLRARCVHPRQRARNLSSCAWGFCFFKILFIFRFLWSYLTFKNLTELRGDFFFFKSKNILSKT